jgi:protoporphyrinogen IX oxidase
MYEWLKVIHLLALISWMAGLFYLPRLFVYHVGETVGSAADATFKVMERRLLKAIMRPASVVTLISGLGLLHVSGVSLTSPWLVIKLLAVAVLFAFHGFLERYVGLFAQGFRGRDHRYFRILNEAPTVLLIVIVIAVVVKPFS